MNANLATGGSSSLESDVLDTDVLVTERVRRNWRVKSLYQSSILYPFYIHSKWRIRKHAVWIRSEVKRWWFSTVNERHSKRILLARRVPSRAAKKHRAIKILLPGSTSTRIIPSADPSMEFFASSVKCPASRLGSILLTLRLALSLWLIAPLLLHPL